MSKFDELVQRTIKWSEGIDLFNQSTEMKQVSKAFEEIAELIAAIDDNNEYEIKDAIGDILVCAVNANYLYRGLGLLSPQPYTGVSFRKSAIIEEVSSSLLDNLYNSVAHSLNELCASIGVDINECFEMAVETIEKRKLLMDNGKAVKWENMTDGQRDQWRVLNENN